MREIKEGNLGGPCVKWNEVIFCNDCADADKDCKTAGFVNNNLTRHHS